MNLPRLHRRHVLSAPALATASSLVAHVATRPDDDVPFPELDIDAFGDRWRALIALRLESASATDERYLSELESLVLALEAATIPRAERFGFERDGVRTGGSWGDGELGLVEIQLEPHAVIPAHNHVAYNFLTLCLEGDCELRQYRPVDAPPPNSEGTSDWFHVEEVKGGILTPGRTATLSRTWDNIHGFQAGPEGATLIDFMTHLPDAGEGYTAFSALDIEEPLLPDTRRLRRGRWIGNPFRE